jgi:RNA polymerase sigma-70 factor (ECF subfamily)
MKRIAPGKHGRLAAVSIGTGRATKEQPMIAGGELAVEQGRGRPAADADRPLVDAARAGDLAAFDALVARHWRRLASVAGRFLADPDEVDDAVQEALVRAFRQLGGFRGEASVQTWLIRILVNVCKNRRRSPWWRRLILSESQAAALGSDHAPDPQALAEVRLSLQQLEQAVERLPERLRLPVVLHFYEELSGPEIAAVLGWNESTVWTRIYTAYRELRKALEGTL